MDYDLKKAVKHVAQWSLNPPFNHYMVPHPPPGIR